MFRSGEKGERDMRTGIPQHAQKHPVRFVARRLAESIILESIFQTCREMPGHAIGVAASATAPLCVEEAWNHARVCISSACEAPESITS